ncbi:uncharacterized protein LOC141600747 [Silene latifolia]|uniref:uncharacterized protein LOC141600747 n=1 Tax=Silene latifolia TaxID=37657 RepID=UPI003D771331
MCQSSLPVVFGPDNRVYFIETGVDEPETTCSPAGNRYVEVYALDFEGINLDLIPRSLMKQKQIGHDEDEDETTKVKLSSIWGTCFFEGPAFDENLHGPKFTWCNNRKGNARIYERLDKALGSSDWCFIYPNTGITHLPIQCSDHAPIILDTELFGIKRKSSYKVEAWCLDYDECNSIVSREWCKMDRGSPSFRVLCKIKRVRRFLKNWTLNKRKECQQKWTDFDDNLSSELEDIFQGNNEESYDICHAEYLEFNKAASQYWKQRAKVHWLREGDACTKFFFNSVKERYNRNIFWLSKITEYGVLTREVLLVFLTYLAKHGHLFSLIKHRLHSDQMDYLGKPFTRKEVRTAVFQMSPNKSPGPDGMPAILYQKHWCHITNDVTEAVLSILNSGNVLKEFNRTSVVLIPKTSAPETVRDYRPISLYNVIMKIVTKCISNRLKTLMLHLVGERYNCWS